MKKYHLTEETKEMNGKLLHRIKAARDFSDVEAGDLGGWVESENNLSHQGDCWVYDDAMVFDNARVTENVRVKGTSRVFDKASISGNVLILDNARVSGLSRVCENAVIDNDAVITGASYIIGNAHIGKNAKIKKLSDYIYIGAVDAKETVFTFYNTDFDIFVCAGKFNGSVQEYEDLINETYASTRLGMQRKTAIKLAKLFLEY